MTMDTEILTPFGGSQPHQVKIGNAKLEIYELAPVRSYSKELGSSWRAQLRPYSQLNLPDHSTNEAADMEAPSFFPLDFPEERWFSISFCQISSPFPTCGDFRGGIILNC